MTRALRAAVLCLCTVALMTSTVRADDAPPAPPPRTTHADVDGAPKAEQATGIAASEAAEPGRAFRTLMRVLLFVPRWTFWLAVQPVRGGLWAWERYQIGDRAVGIFFNDDETLGAYPLAFFETGFGLNVGGRVIYRDLFGTGGRARLRASYGGRFRQQYSLKLTTGELLGDKAEVEVESGFQIYPKSRFFGYGNADLVERDDITMIVDPRARDVALRTRFRHDDITSKLTGVVHLSDDLDLRFGGGYTQRDFDEDVEPLQDDPDIQEIFDVRRLPGYYEGLANISAEVELVYDSRRGTRFWVSEVLPDAGWKLAGFIGGQTGLGDDPSSFLRYGFDLQRVFDIYDGTRTVYLRTYLEGVTGSTDEVPFVDLPRLGGPIFLRGYYRDRFRDRVAALGSIEYRWMVGKMLAAYLFADAGRVYPRLSDLAVDDLRVGYGGGIQFHTATTYRGRFDISTSRDGGLFFNLSFDPVFDTSSRTESL